MLQRWNDQARQTINTDSYYVPYIILLILAFIQGEEQPDYSKRTYILVYRSEIIGACVRQPGYVRRSRTTICGSI